MDGSEHALPLRDPRSAMHETDYWQAVLGEVAQACDVPPRIADPLVEIAAALLELTLSGDTRAAVDRIGGEVRKALAAIEELGDRVDAITALAEGRILSLRRETGLQV